MSVSVIKNTEPKNINIPLAAMAGAGAGLAARHILPVYKPEIDMVLFGESDVIRDNNIKHARKKAVDEIVKMFRKDRDNEALQLFLERTKASVKYSNAQENQSASAKAEAVKMAKAAKAKIKAAPEEVQKEIKVLTEKVINKVRAARKLTEANLKTSVKQMRPFAPFLLPGIALGVVSAYIYNVVGTISKD